MSFTSLTIRFQSAGMIPPPYTHFYTLAAAPTATDAVHVDFSITYTDRENLDEEDITGEGFTLTDAFSWSGTLGSAWHPVVTKLVSETRLIPLQEDKLTESDDFLDVAITTGPGKSPTQTGTPTDADSFLYPVQELIQAIYEAAGKEKPFELTYLSYQQLGDTEVRLRASFADRDVVVNTVKNRQETRKSVPWETLKALMATIYAHDYNPEDSLPAPPRKDGHYLSLGTGDWYDIGAFTDVYRALARL